MKISKKVRITFWVNLIITGLLLATLILTQRMDSPLSTLGNILGILLLIFYSPTIWIFSILFELFECSGMQQNIIMLILIPVNSLIWSAFIAILGQVKLKIRYLAEKNKTIKEPIVEDYQQI